LVDVDFDHKPPQNSNGTTEAAPPPAGGDGKPVQAEQQ
jgi:hypothetical protein